MTQNGHRRPAPPPASHDVLEPTIGPEELAAILGTSPRTVRRYVTQGAIPAHRVGRNTRFTRGDVEAILEQTATPAVAPMRNGTGRTMAAR